MRTTIDTSKGIGLTFFPETVEAEITQNIYCILNTIKGSVPMYRQFGINNDFDHKPMAVAESSYAAAIVEAISKFEPRAQVVRVSFTSDSKKTGHMFPIVEVTFLEAGE